MAAALSAQPFAIAIQGGSMRPYLVEGDIVWVRPYEPGHFRTDAKLFGELVLARPKNPDGHAVLHRVISTGVLKGDRAREADDLVSLELEIVGVVEARIQAAAHPKWIFYGRPLFRGLHRMQAQLSKANHSRYPRWRWRIAAGSLIILGKLGRLSQDYFFGKKSNLNPGPAPLR